MNLYISIVKNVVIYIEANVTEHLTLSSISHHFHFSQHHFSRLFKMITGCSLKVYINKRKLNHSLLLLCESSVPVTEVAYSLGFEYPEVFSRLFKKQYGVSPSEYRANASLWQPAEEVMDVVERDVVNYQGSFSLKESYELISGMYLAGVFVEADENAGDFEERLQCTGNEFLRNSKSDTTFAQDYFYSAVRCIGDNQANYSVFYGKVQKQKTSRWQKYVVPNGWYAVLSYRGTMLDMRKTLTDDYYKWIIAKEIDIRNSEIGMIMRYKMADHNDVTVLIPVNEPKHSK